MEQINEEIWCKTGKEPDNLDHQGNPWTHVVITMILTTIAAFVLLVMLASVLPLVPSPP